MDKPRLRHLNWAMPWRARAAAREDRAVLDLLIKADRGQLPWQAADIADTFHVRSGTVSIWVIDRAGGPGPGAVRLRFSPWGAAFTTTISQAPGREALNAGLDELYSGAADLAGKTAPPQVRSNSDTRPHT